MHDTYRRAPVKNKPASTIISPRTALRQGHRRAVSPQAEFTALRRNGVDTGRPGAHRASRAQSPGLGVGSSGMTTTTKITLSVDSVALSLAQRAAELDGVSVSAVVSRVLRRHILTDYGPSDRPYTGADRQRDEDQATAEVDLAEQAARLDQDRRERRAAG
ncbi:MAG: hypothetical protein ACRDRT_19510 [Pseudonocardiaceae bacterium]